MARLKLINGPPLPTEQQIFQVRGTRFGTTMFPWRKKKTWKRRKPLDYWTQFTEISIAGINRFWLQWAGAYWKEVLTPGERADWNLAAFYADWYNYHGLPAHAGGFELFVMCQRLHGYRLFHPYHYLADVQQDYLPVFPYPWDPPPGPTVGDMWLFDGGEFFIELLNCPDIHYWWIHAVVGQRREQAIFAKAKSYIVAWSDTWAIEPDLSFCSVYLSYPFLPNEVGKLNRARVGIQWFNPDTLQFSLFTWLAIE